MTLFCEKHLVKSMDKLSLVLSLTAGGLPRLLPTHEFSVFPNSTSRPVRFTSSNVLLRLQPAHLHALCLSLEPHRVPRLLQQTPNRSPAVGSLSLGYFVPLCHPQNKVTAPWRGPRAPPTPGLCLLPGAHCPLWGQLLGWQGVCPPAPWCGHVTQSLCLLPFVCHTFFLPLFLLSYSSIMIQLRRHFLNPRLACPFLDFCTF